MAPLLLAVVLALAALYWFPGRRWMATWGASPADLALDMAGDRLISDGTYRTTLAITVAADPMDVWAWLVQMRVSPRRALQLRLARPPLRLSGPAERDHDSSREFQRLQVGDEIPIWARQGLPGRGRAARPALVLSGTADGVTWVWQFGLFPLGGGRTPADLPHRRPGAARVRRVVRPAGARTGRLSDDAAHADRTQTAGGRPRRLPANRGRPPEHRDVRRARLVSL